MLPSGARPRPRVLCVDDEPLVLTALQQTLRRQFDVVTAEGGAAGIDALNTRGPFAVVISDFQMPKMNGAQFLAQARVLAPSAVRMLLTGHASLEDAIVAVNEGSIFRFLTKPCSPQSLQHAIEDAIEQARIQTADRELLERKLDAMSAHLTRAERLASLGTMAGAVGHELNNLLAAFGAALDGIRDDSAVGKRLDDGDLAALEQVRAHLTTHARNLLQLGRPAKDGPGRCDLPRAVADAVGLLRSAGILRYAEVELKMAEPELTVAIAGTVLEQVLINLIKNAVEAAVEGQRPRIAISVERSGAHAVCGIADFGTGISTENLARIFDPYFTTKSADRGSGLGLFVVRQIIERHRGALTVVSEEGAGSTFTFQLPAV